MQILSIHMNSSVNGGAEVVYIHGNRLLAEKGHSIAWLSIGAPQEAIRRGEPVFFIPELPGGARAALSKLRRHFFNLEAMRLAERAIDEFRPGIVHIHTILGYRYLSPSVLLPFRKHNIPIVQTLHDFGLICPASFLLSHGAVCEACQGGRYYLCTLKRCMNGSLPRSLMASIEAYLKDYFYRYDKLISGYIAPSHFLRQKFIEFGFSPHKIEVVPNAYFQASSLTPKTPKQCHYLLFAGRLSPEKGVDILVRASQGLDMPVKIAGDGVEREFLQSLQAQIGADNVEFLGSQPHETMSLLYQDAAFTVMPSRWYENSPLVILESFSHATPVIAARMGAMPEFVKEGQTGFLFTPDNPDDLRQVIRAALAQPDSQETMGNNAYRYVQTEHTPDLYGERLENVLKKHLRIEGENLL